MGSEMPAYGRNPQIRLGRQHIVDVEQQGRAEIVEHLEEDQGGAGNIAGHGQGKDDAPEQPGAAGAEVLGGLFHGPVDV
jgi:hypothetical protein